MGGVRLESQYLLISLFCCFFNCFSDSQHLLDSAPFIVVCFTFARLRVSWLTAWTEPKPISKLSKTLHIISNLRHRFVPSTPPRLTAGVYFRQQNSDDSKTLIDSFFCSVDYALNLPGGLSLKRGLSRGFLSGRVGWW